MSMEVYLTCLNDDCHWYGDPTELVSKTDDLNDTDYSYCPDCGGNEFDEEEAEAEDSEM